MKFELDRENCSVCLSGDFTFTDHGQFRDLMSRLFEVQSPRLSFDLADLDFIDSAGLGMLLLARDEAEKRSCKIVLRRATGQVKRMFGLTKFDMLFALED